MHRWIAALLTCFLLAACAVSGPTSVVETPRGVAEAAFPVVRWAPPEAPRAVILALHGFNDRKAAFDDFGTFAAAHGVLVEAYDQRGFGARPDRGQWPGVEALVDEARERVQKLRAQFPGKPIYVLGESMGAAVATVAFSDPQAPPVDGVILSAPAVWGGKDLDPFYRRVLTVAALIAPGMKLTGSSLRIQASDNIPALIKLGRDPLYIRATRVDAIAGLVQMMDLATERGPALRPPALVLTGARDEVVPPQAQADFIASLPPGHCTAVTYLDGWHLLLADLQRERVYQDILAWVDGTPLPSGLGRACGGGDLPAT